MRTRASLVALMLAVPATAFADEEAPPPPAPDPPSFHVRAIAEGGFLAPIYNVGAFGPGATRFDFLRDGGQRTLSFYTRWSAELGLGERHTLVFLYQPLELESTFTPDREVRERGAVLPAGKPARAVFGFPFYRFSYLYDLLPESDAELALGFTGQIRNASITFQTLDGTSSGTARSVGFVPAAKVRGRLRWASGAWAGFEVDGIYAPIQVFNGSDNETTGAIIDANVRAGVRVDACADVFANFRWLGGGATNEEPADPTKNWLHFFFVGLGASLELTRAACPR